MKYCPNVRQIIDVMYSKRYRVLSPFPNKPF